MITALGGGIIRDILLGALPPATFVDWRYLAVAAAGGLIAFLFSRGLSRFTSTIDVLDAAGLSLFAVTGRGVRRWSWGSDRCRRSSSGRSRGWVAARCGTC